MRNASGSYARFHTVVSASRIARYIAFVRNRAISGVTRTVTRIGCRGFTIARRTCGTRRRSPAGFRPAPARLPPHDRNTSSRCRLDMHVI
jgi:hypothetical protein